MHQTNFRLGRLLRLTIFFYSKKLLADFNLGCIENKQANDLWLNYFRVKSYMAE